jgi:D-alanyl-lipoteichoic acid acyltransferase DltB (MBOAT superfamily)
VTAVDYLAVLGMAKTGRKARWVALSVVANLALLGFFKYGKFIVENLNVVLERLRLPVRVPPPAVTFVSDGLNALLHGLGIPYTLPPLDYLLPVGISFYVFQSMSYTIDYYRGRAPLESNFLRYATFVAFFPQVEAGPIGRAGQLLPQLRSTPKITRGDLADGLSLFVVGLFKKKALADYLALYVDPVYTAPSHHQAPALLLATFAFAWQIYFDFSGYTDMARGIARLLGIRLMLNFNNPYLADGLGDFWRRWHISLSTWFRDCVYIPLGGNRKGELVTYVNMCQTMVISGLWHGAMWTFVIWGALHALGRCCTRALEQSAFYRDCVPKLLKQLGTFGFVCFAWIFFRAESFHDACLIVGRIAGFAWADPACPLLLLAMVAAVWLYQFSYESVARWVLALSPVRVALVVLMLFYLAAFSSSADQAFIYFQF